MKVSAGYFEHYQIQLRVLKMAISDAWGGLEQTAVNDACILARAGVQVHLLVRAASRTEKAALEIDLPNLHVIPFSFPIRRGFDYRFFRFLRALYENLKPQILHLHQGSLLTTVVPSLFGHRKVALVLSRHILNSHSKRDPFHAILYRRVDYIAVLSKTMKLNLRATFPVPEKKLRIVNLGLDLESFNRAEVDPAQMRQHWNIPDSAFLIGVVGRLDPMKRQDVLIKAAAKLQIHIPQMHLVIVGDETPGLKGKYLQSLQKVVSDLRLNNKVSIVGAETRIPAVMAALDVFVMPSKEEAFGLVAIEAMAMGIPSILSHSGSSGELARGGRALLFRPGDAFSLSERMREIYEMPDRGKKMAAIAEEHVRKRFSHQYRLEQTLEIYGRSLRRRHPDLFRAVVR